MLLHAKGNLIDMAEAGKFHIIVHGCNCFNTMGSGIAKEIRNRYPRAYESTKSVVGATIDTASATGSLAINLVKITSAMIRNWKTILTVVAIYLLANFFLTLAVGVSAMFRDHRINETMMAVEKAAKAQEQFYLNSSKVKE